MTILYQSPGQIVTIFLETADNGVRYDGYGYFDGYYGPTVDRIILPSLTLASNYPQPMIRIDTGLYYYNFTLPTGASSIGSYIVDVSYFTDQSQLFLKAYQVTVTAPSGNFGLTSTI